MAALIALLPLMGCAQSSGGEQAIPGFSTNTALRIIELSELRSGGPPKDGIPAIDNPHFVSQDEAAAWLADQEPVILLRIGDVARIYPLQIPTHHEIANDEFAGVPVTVTFCPLCYSAIAFDRRVATDEGELLPDFGVSGMLRNSDPVMYDRQTETWWQQATGEGIVGQYAGERLTFVASPLISWKTFKDRYPDGQVLSRDTGFRRDYGRNPYAGYDGQDSPIRRFFRGRPDARLPAMERVVAVDFNNESVAGAFALRPAKSVITEGGGGSAIGV